jgi:hypothetical protein
LEQSIIFYPTEQQFAEGKVKLMSNFLPRFANLGKTCEIALSLARPRPTLFGFTVIPLKIKALPQQNFRQNFPILVTLIVESFNSSF